MQEKPTPAIETALGELGLSFETLNESGKRGDLIGAMQMLNSAGLDTASALEIFGRKPATPRLSLPAPAADWMNSMRRCQDSTGTADKMRKIMESGLPGSVAQSKSAIEGLQLAIG